MKLDLASLKNRAAWDAAGVKLPEFDIPAVIENTKATPTWVHFGAGNIFRGYVANLQNDLLNKGLASTGIIAVDSSDGDQLVKVYRPFDNLTLLVTLYADGKAKKEVVASVTEALHADWGKDDQLSRLREVFAAPTLQLCSFTITEKGYAVKGGDGKFTPAVEHDIEAGPDDLTNVMTKVTALLYHRYMNGAYPIAVVSMDNCSHNGEKLKASILSIAEAWLARGFVPQGFVDYLSDEERVSFPWSMIDKITPRPNKDIADKLEALGIENMQPIARQHGAAVAPFVNAESCQYLVIEDRFPNGRPPLEKAGVIMTDRDTVNKTERMKVTTCLNPLHTALAVLGCLLGYKRIYEEMRDDDLRRLVEHIGYAEGMPVVTNPGVLDPRVFLDAVLNERLPNPYIPDMPQRIACDTSQKIPVRFGETIKAYIASDSLELSSLRAIPFAIAAWLRYLLAMDDELSPMELSDDPRIPELQEKLAGIEIGKPESCAGQLDAILSDDSIFGADLCKAGLSGTVGGFFKQMLAGRGAVRSALHELVESF